MFEVFGRFSSSMQKHKQLFESSQITCIVHADSWCWTEDVWCDRNLNWRQWKQTTDGQWIWNSTFRNNWNNLLVLIIQTDKLTFYNIPLLWYVPLTSLFTSSN